MLKYDQSFVQLSEHELFGAEGGSYDPNSLGWALVIGGVAGVAATVVYAVADHVVNHYTGAHIHEHIGNAIIATIDNVSSSIQNAQPSPNVGGSLTYCP